MMNIVIEKMSDTHITQIGKLETECFSVPWSENALREELTNEFARFFVVLCDGEVAGYIGAHNILGEVYITNVAVNPEFRRRGIGKALVRKLIEKGKEKNLSFWTLVIYKTSSFGITSSRLLVSS